MNQRIEIDKSVPDDLRRLCDKPGQWLMVGRERLCRVFRGGQGFLAHIYSRDSRANWPVLGEFDTPELAIDAAKFYLNAPGGSEYMCGPKDIDEVRELRATA